MRIRVASDLYMARPGAPGSVEKPIDLTRAEWHATFSAGASVAATDGFTDPDPDEADRIPEVALAAGGSPGDYEIVGTWDGKVRSVWVTTVANETVKAALPLDTITGFFGPEPGADLTLYMGDSYAEPPARMLYVGTTGDVACQLDGESAVTVRTGVPAGDWNRLVRRVEHAGDGRTKAANLRFVW